MFGRDARKRKYKKHKHPESVPVVASAVEPKTSTKKRLAPEPDQKRMPEKSVEAFHEKVKLKGAGLRLSLFRSNSDEPAALTAQHAKNRNMEESKFANDDSYYCGSIPMKAKSGIEGCEIFTPKLMNEEASSVNRDNGCLSGFRPGESSMLFSPIKFLEDPGKNESDNLWGTENHETNYDMFT